ncbi:MAG: hypothetical protein M0030_04525 [Actinomycetota bacterium]|nr:hypothetical protein [Actinomycetota bacterium]
MADTQVGQDPGRDDPGRDLIRRGIEVGGQARDGLVTDGADQVRLRCGAAVALQVLMLDVHVPGFGVADDDPDGPLGDGLLDEG